MVEAQGLRILILDTLTPGSPHGGLCAGRLEWIESQLADERPTLIAMHHPPFAAEVEWMEPADPHWADALAALVARHPAVVRIVCGHVHRPMTRLWAAAVAMSAPSTALQVYPDLRPGAPRALSFEAPGLLLHRRRGGEVTSLGLSIPGLHDAFAA